MKFLVITRRRDVPVPPDAIAGALLAQRDWMQQRLDDGTFDVAYAFAQGGGGVAIVNAASGEELSRIAAGAPLFAVSAAEVYPLSGIDSITAYADAMRRTVGVPA